MSEIHELARDLGNLPGELISKVEKVMPATGMAMKKRMQADLMESQHFKQIASSVSYEVKNQSFAGDAAIQVEIGIEMGRGESAGLNHVAYFGTSVSGGGTVSDPVVPMRLEAPKFFGFMEMAAEGLL